MRYALEDSRRAAHVGRAGALVTLEDQDRGLWNKDAIQEASKVLDRAVRLRRRGPQAAIAACHAQAPTAGETDWHEIAVLYRRLSEIVPTPVVLLNRAVAVAMADGAATGLALVDELDGAGALAGYYLLPATRADLLRRLGRHGEAVTAYRRAREFAPTDTERRFLRRRLAEVSGAHHG